MINTGIAFTRFDISQTSVGRAIRDVTTRIELEETAENLRHVSEGTQCTKASEIIHELLGLHVNFDNHHRAVLTAQAVVQALVKNNCVAEDAQEVLDAAVGYANKFLANDSHQYFFAKKESAVTATVEKAVSAVVDVKVAVKADGTVKKGGRQVLVDALYQKFVVEATEKPTNKWFKELLVKEAGLTAAGASTYAYNVDQKLKLLVKGKKGE